MHRFFRQLKKRFGSQGREINPEDIFIDSANLPGLNRDRLEGTIERPIGSKTFYIFKFALVFLIIFLGGKLWGLQVSKGEVYAEVSEQNRLIRQIIFADRGVIFDRNGLPLAQNAIKEEGSDYAAREYPDQGGLSAAVGYVRYPSQDKSGLYYDELYHGQSGVEKIYDAHLAGKNGSKLSEINAKGELTSESVVESPVEGQDLHLSLDGKLTERLYEAIRTTALDRGFTGGAGVIMDVTTGEVLALTSYPEFDQAVVTSGENKEEIARLLSDKSTPFLNRAISGLYTPGSIVKPIVALGALNEGVITPEKRILSTGALTVPNPYDPNNPSIFRDWKAHGYTNMREALAVSSDVYFYQVGGGFGTQKGLGITKLDDYFTLFGMSEKSGIDLPAEAEGYIATPYWKARVFPDDPDWRLGNTYITAIGQYGTQITPLAAARWTAAVANGGKLLTPSVLKGGLPEENRVHRSIELPTEFYDVARDGMRLAVTSGTAAGLSIPQVKVAAKTGTAELGASKQSVNSWITGFFPYENPKYAFAVVMERGPVTNTIGGVFVMRQMLDWMVVNTPEYLK